MRRRKLSKHAIEVIASGKPPPATEDEVQAVIVDGLRLHGFIVLVTTRRVKRCRKCGEFNHVGDGASKGIADLLVRRPAWPQGVWKSLEVKRPGPVRWSSTEQRLLAEAGDTIVVQSLEDALAAANATEGPCSNA